MSEHFHRRNLPHLYNDTGRFFITYRLYDSLLNDKIRAYSKHLQIWSFDEYKENFESYENILNNKSHKKMYLQIEEIAEICKHTIHYPDGKEYKLSCYCIMPNHVHILFELLPGNKGIDRIMKGIKGISALKCNKVLKTEGKFWQDESFDRFIRTDLEFDYTFRYIIYNPVKAGLVSDWRNWKYTYYSPELYNIRSTDY